MEKSNDTRAHHEELSASSSDIPANDNRRLSITHDAKQEHEWTLRYVLANHKKLVFWTFFWAFCAIGWGFDAQVNGAMISVPAFRRNFGEVYKDEYVIPAAWQTAFNVISSPGGFFGGFACSFIADRFGRRQALLVGVLFCTGGIVGQLVSNTRIAFLMSKLVLGFGLGFYLTIGPMMTSEITPVVLRGVATAGVNLGIAIGQLLSNSAIAGFGNRSDHWSYHGPFALQLIFAIVLLAGYPFAPESPVFLVRRGRSQEALRVLEKLYGTQVDNVAKLALIEATIAEEEGKKKATILDCFRGTDRIRTMISMGVFVCQHAVGIIFVLGYSSYFFQLAGLSTTKSFGLGVGVTACGVTGNLCSWFIINGALGRRRVFVWGMAALTAMLFFIGIMDVVPTAASKWVEAATTVVWAFVYFLTIGAMAFAILGETSSSALRAPTVALATATQSVMGVAMNFAIPYMVNPDEGNLKGKVGFVFGGLGFIGTIWAYVFVPELKGRTFREIDMMFFDRIPPRKMGKHHIALTEIAEGEAKA